MQAGLRHQHDRFAPAPAGLEETNANAPTRELIVVPRPAPGLSGNPVDGARRSTGSEPVLTSTHGTAHLAQDEEDDPDDQDDNSDGPQNADV
jgi:hypothetical protein